MLKESIKLLRKEATRLQYRIDDGFVSPVSTMASLVADYIDAADLLEQLDKGDKGPNQVQVVTQENTVLNAENLLTTALFVGINPKAAKSLVELVEYIQELECGQVYEP